MVEFESEGSAYGLKLICVNDLTKGSSTLGDSLLGGTT